MVRAHIQPRRRKLSRRRLAAGTATVERPAPRALSTAIWLGSIFVMALNQTSHSIPLDNLMYHRPCARQRKDAIHVSQKRANTYANKNPAVAWPASPNKPKTCGEWQQQ